MGRIYGLPGEAGARDGTGCRAFTAGGVKIPFPLRVTLDADADEGLATVTAVVTGADGQPLVDYERSAACEVTFRTWVRVVPRGRPDPPKTPDAVLYKNADGSLQWCAADPIPDPPTG